MDKDIYERGGLSIIVVEDNQGDYILVEDYLLEKFKNLKVTHFIEYKTASTYFKNELAKCDLILLDLHLPDANGIELIKDMVNLCKNIPIIILTGYSDLPVAKKSLELGISDFLVKDEINPILLHKSIEFAISRSNYVRHIEFQNEKLKNIAWTQSHETRAPLASLMGLINLLQIDIHASEEVKFMLQHIKISADKLDDIVHKMVKESEIINLKND